MAVAGPLVVTTMAVAVEVALGYMAKVLVALGVQLLVPLALEAAQGLVALAGLLVPLKYVAGLPV